MLVLSRKTDEKIVVPTHGIVFTILEVRGDKVRIGISAPAEIPVYREEVWERIVRNEGGLAGLFANGATAPQAPTPVAH
jgi:carbon storage regulator